MKAFRGTVIEVGHKAGEEGVVPFVAVDDGEGHVLRIGSDEGDDAGGSGDFRLGDVVDVVMTVRVRLVGRGSKPEVAP